MDVSTDYFDRLPDEVIQLIFSAISDCKSLVRCMSVSKAFRQQSVRVSSLSIVCPGNFSSYDERLQKIYSMVKRFRNLQSLVVRVGQPKEEPPSWARCMRYAEIGGSVEKFVFMAAKSGDFSELDFALLGLDNIAADDKLLTETNSTDKVRMPETSATKEVDNDERSSYRETEREGNENESTEAWSDFESDEETIQRVRAEGGERNMEDVSLDGKSGNSSKYCKFLQSNASFLRGPGQRRLLSDFSLRQVIAPSNDVLNRMLPVIHFAIVQGLNELRDSIPAFVSEFPELRRFLLVDMVESITVYMREHHIQEIRALHLEMLNECDRESSEALPKVDPIVSGTEQDRRELQAKEDRDGHLARDTDIVKVMDARNLGTDEGPCNAPYQTGSEGVSSVILEDHHTGEREETGQIQAENSNEGNILQVANKHDDHSWNLKSIIRETEKKEGKELLTNYVGDVSFGKNTEQYHGTLNTGFPSWFEPPESSLHGNTAVVKGKGKLIEHHNFCSQMEVSYTNAEASCTDSIATHDCRSFQVSDNIGFEDFNARNSSSECPARNATTTTCEDYIQAQDGIHMSSLPPSGGFEDGSIHVEEYYLGCFNARHTGLGAADACHGSSQLRSLGKVVKGRCHAACHYPHLGVVADISGDGGELNTVNTERDTDQLLQLRYVEGWDGRSDGSDGDYFREREDVQRFKGCKLSKEGKVDMASRHPFKRCPKFDNCRMKDRNIRFACLRRRDDNSVNFDSSWREENRDYRCLRFMGRMERADLTTAVKGNAGNTEDEVGAKTHFCAHTSDTEKDCGACCIQDFSIGQGEASSSWSDDCLPGTSGDTNLSPGGRNNWKQMHALERSVPKEAATALTCEVDISLLDGSPEENYGPQLSCNSGKHCVEVAHNQETRRNTADKEADIVETNDNDKFARESTEGPELQGQQMGNNMPIGESRDMHSESPRLLVERPVETEDWRCVWRDRMRRLRDNLREAPDQWEHEGNQEERRERTREVLRKQQRQLEKDALSFDYTFWRAEHVAARNYVLSDVSMCIATHASRPLRDTDKESLKHAALAGPLLVATFSHVNKHHTGHNL